MFGFIADLTAAGRAKALALYEHLGAFGASLERRLQELHDSSLSCERSATSTVQEVKQGMNRIRVAVDQREAHLLAEITKLQQVSDLISHSILPRLCGLRRCSLAELIKDHFLLLRDVCSV